MPKRSATNSFAICIIARNKVHQEGVDGVGDYIWVPSKIAIMILSSKKSSLEIGSDSASFLRQNYLSGTLSSPDGMDQI